MEKTTKRKKKKNELSDIELVLLRSLLVIGTMVAIAQFTIALKGGF